MPLPASDMECPKCYDFTVESCLDEIVFQLGLDALPNYAYYTIMFEDIFGNIYTQDVVTDINGDFTIDTTTADFPEGFFATTRDISVVVTDDNGLAVKFIVDLIEYDSICLHVNNNVNIL